MWLRQVDSWRSFFCALRIGVRLRRSDEARCGSDAGTMPVMAHGGAAGMPPGRFAGKVCNHGVGFDAGAQ